MSKFRYLSRENNVIASYAVKSDKEHLKFITVEKLALKLWSLESYKQLFLDFNIETPGEVLESSLLTLSPVHLALGLIIAHNQGVLHFLTLTLVSIYWIINEYSQISHSRWVYFRPPCFHTIASLWLISLAQLQTPS